MAHMSPYEQVLEKLSGWAEMRGLSVRIEGDVLYMDQVPLRAAWAFNNWSTGYLGLPTQQAGKWNWKGPDDRDQYRLYIPVATLKAWTGVKAGNLGYRGNS